MCSGMTPMIVAGCPFTRRRRPEHVRIGTVPVLPETVADDDNGFGTLSARHQRREITAQQRLLPETSKALAVSHAPPPVRATRDRR